ncbi:class I SAM-dependent methyltransferase [Paenibacillus sp. KN14-4R]|uniref:class I SAM-dependent methyltransferase n=1 Tax=Paenibacillus sp. KN14-4R TaxID=3445773 RepID=UPI003FA09DE3
MKTLKQYWNESFSRPNLMPVFDNWLDKYDEYLNKDSGRIVDLGCGIGNNALYLFEKGILAEACDISEEALKKLTEIIPRINTICLDMTEGLPFENDSIRVLIADLSLHYFDEDTTFKVISEIHRVLRLDGLLLCRLNSINEIINKGEVSKSKERYLLENEGIYRRFFDRHEINRFFNENIWTLIHAEEYELDRYKNKKILWEIAMKPRYIV